MPCPLFFPPWKMFLTYLCPRLTPAFLLCSSSLTKPLQSHHSSPPLSLTLLLWLVCLASFSHFCTSFAVPNPYHISHLPFTHFISTPGLPVSFPVGSILLWFLPFVVRISGVPYFFFFSLSLTWHNVQNVWKDACLNYNTEEKKSIYLLFFWGCGTAELFIRSVQQWYPEMIKLSAFNSIHLCLKYTGF